MKKIILLILACMATFGLFSILGKSNKQPVSPTTPTDTLSDNLTLGLFKGVLPCKECSGILTELTLVRTHPTEHTGTFLLRETKQQKNAETIEHTGVWTFSDATYFLDANDQTKRYFFQKDEQTLAELYDKNTHFHSEKNHLLTRVNPVASTSLSGIVHVDNSIKTDSRSTVQLALFEIGLTGEQETKIAEETYSISSSKSAAFLLSYSSKFISPSKSYGIYATVFSGGKEVGKNQSPILVITHGNPYTNIDFSVSR